jgi:putative endonuclease
MFQVYALRSEKDGRIYVGISQDVNKRLNEHNCGRTRSTKGYRPWELFYFQTVETRLIARELEKKWKTGAGKEFLKKVLMSQ